MRITDVVVNWLENEEWQERPEVGEDEQASSLGFSMAVSDDFAVKGYFEVSEKIGMFKLFMYFFDSKIPDTKIDEVVKWTNMVNISLGIGHLAVKLDDCVLRYYAAIDVEDAAFEPAHVENIVNAGIGAMRSSLPQFMAICFGGKTAEEALKIEPDD